METLNWWTYIHTAKQIRKGRQKLIGRGKTLGKIWDICLLVLMNTPKKQNKKQRPSNSVLSGWERERETNNIIIKRKESERDRMIQKMKLYLWNVIDDLSVVWELKWNELVVSVPDMVCKDENHSLKFRASLAGCASGSHTLKAEHGNQLISSPFRLASPAPRLWAGSEA